MRTTLLTLTLLGLAGAGGLLLATSQRQPIAVNRVAARSHASDAPVRSLLYAQPFALEEPAIHWWREERPTYRAGWLVVLEVDPAFVQPTDRAEPVLYVGHETAERVNHGWKCGRVVAVVPSATDADGFPTLDLARAKIWFGAPALPEQIDATVLEAAFAEASAASPFSSDEIAEARAHGGTRIRFQTREELDQQAALLVAEHCPDER
ncbi:MAG: hypothetical protein IPJ19_02900 [Planctomycetes bacterium]|nr:hypothetical protein [Planctomycetota bacterium]